MDTMHPGAAIEWALRLYKDGVITKADTDGIELVPGNEDGFIELVRKMAYREGFGAVLDSFPLRAAQQIGRGADLYVCQNKGYPCPGSGFMSSIKTTLAHAVATRAHDHLTGSPGIEAPNRQPEMTNEVLESLGRERYGDPTFFTDIDYTARPKYALRVWETENLFCLADMTGTCKFAGGEVLFAKGIRMDDYARLLAAVTGEEFTAEGLNMAAEREMCRQRAFNAREGIRRVDDYPFAYSWMLKNGRQHPKLNYARIKISVEDYGKLLDEYYRLRGCDPTTGIPTREKLESLGLQDVTADLDRRRILPATASR
jgi:aldehyde:ferredoxin oxidoreductase